MPEAPDGSELGTRAHTGDASTVELTAFDAAATVEFAAVDPAMDRPALDVARTAEFRDARGAESSEQGAAVDTDVVAESAATQPPPPAPPSTRTALVWLYVLTAGRFVITTGVTFVVAALVDPRIYGVMALAMVWITFAQALSQHGPALAIIQRQHLGQPHYDAAFRFTLLSGVGYAALFALAAPLWSRYNGTSDLTRVCWVLAPVIVLNAFSAIPESILRRRMEFKRLSLRVLVSGLVSGAAAVAVAAAGYGVWALVVQQIVLAVVSAVTIWWITPWRPTLAATGSALRELSGFSTHSISFFIAYFVSSRVDSLMMGAFFGPVAVGLYRFAGRISDTATDFASGALNQLSLPHLSRFHEDRKGFAESLGKMTHASALVAAPLLGILAPCAPRLIALVGPQWADAAPVLSLLCLSGTALAIGGVFGPALQAAGRVGLSAALAWGGATFSVIMLVIMGVAFKHAGPGHQAAAIAVSTCVLYILAVTASIVATLRFALRVPAWPVLRPAIPSVVAGLVAAATGWAVQPLFAGTSNVPALALTAVAAAVAASAVMLPFDREARRIVDRVLRR